jgi:hypothetical protein
MKLVKVKCAFCGKEFFRPSGRINEAKKFSWKQYCSKECQRQAKIKGIEKICANPICKKRVFREPNELKKSRSGRVFCSLSCAAIVNNQIRCSKLKPKICKAPGCLKKMPSGNKYCSRECATAVRRRNGVDIKKEVLNKIKSFYNRKQRIPVKREMYGLYKRARKVFGTWNKAIKAAGFEPNPVIFSKKFIAKDGHICNSFAEKIIDDWLYERKIEHRREVSYPENKLLSVDFVIGNNFIEYFGLNGVISEYDELIKEKRKLSKKYKLSLIEIYPKDLFPQNRLSKIIKSKI